DSSWAKEGAHTDRMLRHVQRRFDISEFFARQMRTALNAYKYTDDYNNEAMQAATILAQERNAMLLTYEDQTKHSDDYKYQKKWDAYIADLLNSNYTLEEALAKEPKKIVY
ncbi:MAG: hypothetical protein JWR50_2534, partial [Mucilaginibacter sp.]|nr:hypothetical protein [Mucilaginibacter sp.]